MPNNYGRDGQPKKVEVIIEADGSNSFNYSGFVGQQCLRAAEAIGAGLAEYGIVLDHTGFVAKPELSLIELDGQHQGQQNLATGQCVTQQIGQA